MDEHPNIRRARFEALARDELIEPLRRFLARRTDPATADDVLAETLLVCWRRFDDCRSRRCRGPTAWPATAWPTPSGPDAAQQRVAAKLAVVDPPREADEPAGEPRRRPATRRSAALRDEDAELLRLWAWEQLTPAEIATVLDVTPNAVSIRLHRARGEVARGARKGRGRCRT